MFLTYQHLECEKSIIDTARDKHVAWTQDDWGIEVEKRLSFETVYTDLESCLIGWNWINKKTISTSLREYYGNL